MKVRLLGTALLLITLGIATTADARVKEGKNGIYTEKVSTSMGQADMFYQLDSTARLCFAGLIGWNMAAIPCENLARRPGWAEIITWVEIESMPPAKPAK